MRSLTGGQNQEFRGASRPGNAPIAITTTNWQRQTRASQSPLPSIEVLASPRAAAGANSAKLDAISLVWGS